MIGQTIGNFEIVARIGRGGMGEVFLAQQRSIETKVAIKLLQPDVSRDKDHVRRFFNEARAVSRIKHAGITKIFDVGFHEPTGAAYLIMEYLEGETLGERIARIKRIPVMKLADIGRQIASVLDATHSVGIIHRDLKPDNIFLIADNELQSGERVKILDFGIAKLTDTVNGPRTIGTMGTPTYMAPEQWGDSGQVDWRADMYSLGCVIYEMAVGTPPFNGGSIAELYAQHLTFAIPSMRDVSSDLPPTLDQMTSRMLEKNPAARLDSMRAVIRGFDSLTHSSPFITTKPGNIPLVAAADAPGSPAPPAVVAPPVVLVEHDTRNTTLSRLSSQIAARRAGSEKLLPVVLGSLIAVVIAMIIVVVLKRRHAEPAHEAVQIISDAPAPPPIDSPPRELPWNDWIVAANPFVTSHGISVMAHQVTRAEYRHYLASLPNGGASETPVFAWDETNPERPVVWVPQRRAARFCASLQATLPTTEQWTTLAAGSWGLDPTGSKKPGPMIEWTSTLTDGLATLRGATADMPPAQRDSYDTGTMKKSLEPTSGTMPPPNIIAGKEIGFRCVR